MMKIQNKWIIGLGIAMFIGLAGSSVSYGMETTGKDELTRYFEKLIEKKKLPKDIQQEIRRFQLMKEAVDFLGYYRFGMAWRGVPVSLAATSGYKVLFLVGKMLEIDIFDAMNLYQGFSVFDLSAINKNISSIALNDNKVAIGFGDATVAILDTNKIEKGTRERPTLIQENQLQFLDGQDGKIISIAVDDDNVVSLSDKATVMKWDIKNGKLSHTLSIPDKLFSLSTISTDKVMTLSGNNLKIWNIDNEKLLIDEMIDIRYKDKPDTVVSMAATSYYIALGLKYGGVSVFSFDGRVRKNYPATPNWIMGSIAIGDKKVVMLSEDGQANIVPLFMTLQGTPEDNPLLWLIHYSNITQADFIKRAYETRIAGDNLIIALPEKLGEIKEDESQEQRDGRIYFSFPDEVRQYLRDRFNIAR